MLAQEKGCGAGWAGLVAMELAGLAARNAMWVLCYMYG